MSESNVTRIEGGASTVFLQLRQLAKWAIRLQYHIFRGDPQMHNILAVFFGSLEPDGERFALGLVA